MNSIENVSIMRRLNFTSSLQLNKINFPKYLLIFSMFLTGGTGLVLEFIQSTIATFILGNSIHQFSLVMGMMLFMMGVAAWVQKSFNDEYLIEKFILIEIALAIIGGYSPVGVYLAYAYTDHFQLAQYFTIAALGFLIGLEIPIIMRINEKYSDQLKTNLQNVLSADYLGCLVGTFIWVYWLLKKFPLTESSFILAGFNFSIAILTFICFCMNGMVRKKIIISFLIVISAVALMYGYKNNRVINTKVEQHMYDDQILYSIMSQYQKIVLTLNATLNDIRLFINGNLQFASYDEERYHELLIHPALSIAGHKKILMLGGGDGMAAREILKYSDVEEILIVDLDPEMTNFSSTNPIMRKLNKDSFHDARVTTMTSKGVIAGASVPLFQEIDEIDKDTKLQKTKQVASIKIMNIDADKFLSGVHGYWNVIVIDLPDPSTVELSKLYSKEFFMKVKSALSETGVMVIQSTSPGFAKESYLCIGRTIEAAGWNTLPYHENVPSFGDWGWYLCWKDNISSDYMMNKIDEMEINVETRYITNDVFKRAMIFGKGELETNNSSINTLMWPQLLDIYLNDCWKYD